MTTRATGQLGLALPVQGELSGTWGDTVNNGITQYTNIAIAATLTLTNDGAVTLANTTGDASASNIVSSLTGAGTVTAQFAIVRVTGTLTTTKVVTFGSAGSAPYSKTYVVVNAATGGSVSFTAYGGSGVTVAVGESAYVYYNGTNIVKVSSTVATGVTSFQTSLSGLTPSTATTGAVTLAGTLGTSSGGTNLTSFTSGGVVYASSSSALATGSALTFDGTNNLKLQTGAGVTSTLNLNNSDGNGTLSQINFGYTAVPNHGNIKYTGDFVFSLNANAEQMRLTSTGLGIGTSSPSAKLNVYSTAGAIVAKFDSNQSGGAQIGFYGSGTINGYVGTSGNWLGTSATDMAIIAETSKSITFFTGGSGTERMRLDSAGNLGLGVTPSAWGNTYKAFQAGTTSVLAGVASQTNNYVLHNFVNCYNDNTNWVYIASQEAGRYEIARNTHKWFNAPSGTAGNAISFTQAMTLDASGNLGVGVTSMNTTLHVQGAGTTDGSIKFNQQLNSTGAYNATPMSGTMVALKYNTAGDYAGMGGWSIGKENATDGNYGSYFAIHTRFNGAANGEKARVSSDGGFSVGTTANPGAGAIYATGNITAYYSSDIKFKENVRDIPDALATVNAIGGKLFDWKDDYIESKGGADGYFVQKADFGVVAQDVQKVFPIAVRTREDGSLAVDYEKLGALAFAALVELTKRVEALESK